MKKILFASTALVLSAGFAAADVTVGGDGRMGIIYSDRNADGENEWNFTSRIRISFSASGETDGGLTFGGSVRLDQENGWDSTTDTTVDGLGSYGGAGSVYISGAFGKLALGDVDGALNAAVGHVSGVGLTGLDDENEVGYIDGGASNNDPVLLYTYSAGDFTGYLSIQDAFDDADGGAGVDRDATYGVGAKYVFGNYSVAAGYVDNGAGNSQTGIGGTAAFGDATIKAVYLMNDGTVTTDEYALSVDYVWNALTVTAFYRDDTDDATDFERYGLGGSYDLGGGAALKGGMVKVAGEDAKFDFGVSMSF